MEFVKLKFTPGINKETTRYSNTGGWFDCDKIRFRDGLPEKIGGWQKITATTFDSQCRHLFAFRTLDGNKYTVVGTSTRLYLNNDDALYEITPWFDADLDQTDPFTTVNTESTVEVTKSSHGLSVGDRIEIANAVAVGGIGASDINGIRTVAEIVDANTYKFTAGAAATSSTTGGGTGVVDIYYLLQDGLDAQIYGPGWGSDGWGEGNWNEPGTTFVGSGNIRTWSSDAFGEDLLICAWDTGVFYWDKSLNGITPTPTARAIPLDQVSGASGAPTIGRIAMVSAASRHGIVFGCDSVSVPGQQDPLLIRWCDQEDISDWTPSTTNTAGSLLISSGTEILAAKQTRQEILVWTDTDLHSMQYIGGNYQFGINQIAKNTTLIGRNAVAVHLGVAYWMGRNAFYMYDGQIKEIHCTLEDYVFNNIDTSDSEKIFAGTNVDNSEVIWFYQSANGTDNDMYVIYNITEGVWYHGSMERTAWLDRSLSDNPVAASTDGYLYYHEIGNVDGSTSPESQIIAHVESSPIELGDGYTYMFVDRCIPDVTYRYASEGVTPSTTMTLKTYNNPGSASHDSDAGNWISSAIAPLEEFTENVHVRLRGRSLTFRLEDTAAASEKDFSWRLGAPRLSLRTDGRKS